MRMLLTVLVLGLMLQSAFAQQVQSVAKLHEQFKNSRARENKIAAASALNQRSFQPKLSPKEKTQLREIASEFANNTDVLELRIMACVTLSNVGTKDDAPIIHRLLDDSEPRVRHVALRACRKVNDDSTPKAILEQVVEHGFLREPHQAEVLAAIGTPTARKALELLYEKASGPDREMAAKALDELDKKK